MSNSLQPHGLQHTRLSPGVCLNSRPLSPWCHPTIPSSVTPFSSCPQSFPASGSFPVSQLFAWGGQSIGASASVLPMNIQGWFLLGLTCLIFLQSKGLSRVSWHHSSKVSILWHSAFMVQLSNDYWKNHNFNYIDLWLADLRLFSFLGHSQEQNQGALMGREQKHKIHKKNSKNL